MMTRGRYFNTLIRPGIAGRRTGGSGTAGGTGG